MKRKLASFWAGASLGVIEQLSALSFLAVGHELIVYSTDPLEGLPPGVEWRDANEILSTQHIVTHRKTGSVALYSDLFRYAQAERFARPDDMIFDSFTPQTYAAEHYSAQVGFKIGSGIKSF